MCVKEGWNSPMSTWHNPLAIERMAPLLDMRRDLNILLSTPEVKHDLDIHSCANLQALLRTLQQEPTSSMSPLCELLNSARVTLVDVPLQMDKTDTGTDDTGMDDTDTDDTIVINDTTIYKEETAVPARYKLVVRPAALHACERCRRHIAQRSNIPCDRCVDAMADEWAS